ALGRVRHPAPPASDALSLHDALPISWTAYPRKDSAWSRSAMPCSCATTVAPCARACSTLYAAGADATTPRADSGARRVSHQVDDRSSTSDWAECGCTLTQPLMP